MHDNSSLYYVYVNLPVFTDQVQCEACQCACYISQVIVEHVVEPVCLYQVLVSSMSVLTYQVQCRACPYKIILQPSRFNVEHVDVPVCLFQDQCRACQCALLAGTYHSSSRISFKKLGTWFFGCFPKIKKTTTFYLLLLLCLITFLLSTFFRG